MSEGKFAMKMGGKSICASIFTKQPLSEVPEGYERCGAVSIQEFPIPFAKEVGVLYYKRNISSWVNDFIFILEVYVDGCFNPYYSYIDSRDVEKTKPGLYAQLCAQGIDA